MAAVMSGFVAPLFGSGSEDIDRFILKPFSSGATVVMAAD